MKIEVFDIINCTFFLTSIIFGLINGFTRSIINLTALCLTIFAAYLLYPHLHLKIATYFSNELLGNILAGIFSYVIVMIIISVLKHYVVKYTAIVQGNFIDKILGVGLGFLRGILCCLLIFYISMLIFSRTIKFDHNLKSFFATLNSENYPKWFKKAETAPFIIKAHNLLTNMLSNKVLNYNLLEFKSLKDKKKQIDEDGDEFEEFDNDFKDVKHEAEYNENSSKNEKNDLFDD